MSREQDEAVNQKKSSFKSTVNWGVFSDKENDGRFLAGKKTRTERLCGFKKTAHFFLKVGMILVRLHLDPNKD